MRLIKNNTDSRIKIDIVKFELNKTLKKCYSVYKELTMNEVATALLEMLLKWNDKERKDNIKGFDKKE